MKKITLALLIIGGINWGLIGIANFNLVTAIFDSTMIINIVYIVVGMSALISIKYLTR